MNPYGVNVNYTNIGGPLISLKVLYDKLPETTGCEKCEEINGDKKDWCCKSINPSMYYVEFLAVWQEVQNKWSKIKKTALIVRAVKNYLSNKRHKGCIFYDDGCTIYSQRPLQCRSYGVIDNESWEGRIRKIRDEKDVDANIIKQCDLVSFVDGRKNMTAEEEDGWFQHTVECEKRIGVSPSVLKLHDLPGGTYRTFHDHLLIELFEPSVLEMLTKLRMQNPSESDIDETAKLIQETLNGRN